VVLHSKRFGGVAESIKDTAIATEITATRSVSLSVGL